MIRITKFGQVTRFDLSRKLAGRGRYWTTAYLIDNMMVDTGCAHTRGEITDALGSAKLTKIVNTHSHEDHIGANNRLVRDHKEVKIYAHPDALAVLANPRVKQPLHPYRRLFWGWPESSHAKPIDHHSPIETEHYQFNVIPTPGHSSDHLCLYEANQGWLFTGDLYVGGRDRALRAGCDIWGVIESLKNVASLQIRTLFPGSARIRKNPGEELANKIDYLERMGEQVLGRAKEGKTVDEISRELFGGPMLVELITMGHFSRRRLVLSYMGNNNE
jgi:glyoxylase-like metal-dependent hydrolase (beta-lactamase superfamily II)